MFTRALPLASLAAASLALSGCGDKLATESKQAAEDPALPGSIKGPVMVDPDLAHLDDAGSAIAGGGPPVVALPLVETGPEAIAAAKAEAAKVAGKGLEVRPTAETGGEVALANAVTLAQLAGGVKGPGTKCADAIDYGFQWSLRLPATLLIYPRGHLQEALGSDKNGCRLRAVNFLTPVAADDVMAFYYARAKSAGLSARYRQADTIYLLDGSKDSLGFLVRARPHSLGVTAVDLIVNGS